MRQNLRPTVFAPIRVEWEDDWGGPDGHTTKTTQLTEAERAQRQQIVDETRTSTALEGGRASDLTHAAQDRWVRGELTFDEMAAEVKRAHPSTADR